jgi:hypothetical protein
MGPDRVRLGLGWRKTPDPVQEVLLPFKRDGWFETPVWGSESADDAQPNPLSFTVPRPAAVPARTVRGCGARATRMGVRGWAPTGRMPGEA